MARRCKSSSVARVPRRPEQRRTGEASVPRSHAAWGGRACSRAFTLIELTAVLAILALLCTAAAFTFAPPLQRARKADAIAAIRSFDTYTRQAANRFGRASHILIDLDAQSLTRAGANPLHLPPSLKIAEVRLATSRHSAGRVRIPCTAAGLTPTYALH